MVVVVMLVMMVVMMVNDCDDGANCEQYLCW